MATKDDQVAEKLDDMGKAVARIETKLDAVIETQDDHGKALFGSNGSPGMRVKVDRLEQSETRRNRLTLGALAAAIALVMKAAFDWITGQPTPPPTP